MFAEVKKKKEENWQLAPVSSIAYTVLSTYYIQYYNAYYYNSSI